MLTLFDFQVLVLSPKPTSLKLKAYLYEKTDVLEGLPNSLVSELRFIQKKKKNIRKKKIKLPLDFLLIEKITIKCRQEADIF